MGSDEHTAATRSDGPQTQVSPASHDRLQYRELLSRIRDMALQAVPSDARVLAISRGDSRLLEIDGRTVTHFPQTERGQYAGFHPADSTAAITHLESLRAKGAEFLLIPATSFWWLQHYKYFRRHLESRYAVVARDEATCIIFALTREAEASSAGDLDERTYRALITQVREVVDALLPGDAAVVVVSGGDDELLSLGGRRGGHFPQNDQGVYAGYYPADSAAAVSQLEHLRAAGAGFLLFPRTAFWWLDHYRDFAGHLTRTCRLVTRQSHVCLIYAFGTPSAP